MSLLSNRFHEILLCGLRVVALTRNRTDGQTDGQMDGSKTLYPPQLRCVGYNNVLLYESWIKKEVRWKTALHVYKIFCINQWFPHGLFYLVCVCFFWGYLVFLSVFKCNTMHCRFCQKTIWKDFWENFYYMKFP